jgi:RHS repeat-associated protein
LGYNKASYMNKVISPNKHPWVLTPNGAGLPGLVEDPLNNKDEYKYYQDGLLKELTATETGGRSLTHNLKYNALGDLWRAGDTFRGLDTYKYEYKPVNKMLEISEDPGGGSVSYDYDGLNRISHVTRKIEYEGYIRDAVTQYKYTPNGQLEKIFDDAGNFTHYVYDSKDRLKDIYYPEEVGSMHFTYTKNDQIKTSTDLNGTLLTNKYDAAGRLETRTILPGQDVVGTTSETFGYDELGRLHTAGNEDTLVTFDYNTAGRLYQETQELKDSEGNITATYVVGYEYDDNGNLTNLTYPSNIDPSNPASSPKKVVYTPDELDRIDIITSGGKTIADYDYEGKIKISDKKLFNGTLLMKSIFDDGRRPESLTYKSGGNVLFDRGMTWNLMDMKLSETGPGIDKVYTYDTAWRLKTEINKSDKYIKDYSELTIDEDENLEQIRSLKNGKSLVSLECKHENKRHQLTGVDYSNLVDNKVVKFHVVPFYDKNGNMKSFVHQYKYDYKNQLVEVVTGTGLNVEYKYDALGRRTEKIVSAPGGNKVTRYVNAGWRVLEERDGNNALLKRYTYGNGIDEQVAQEYKTNNGLVTVLPMYDSTGNMIGITDDTGKLIEKYSYSVFGLPEFDYDSAAPVIKTVHVIDGKVITGFSEPVNIGTVANGMKVKHEGTVIPGTIEPGAGGKEIKFIPSTPLQPGQMSVDLAETVEDEAGNQMGSPFSNTFMYSGTPTIVHDESAPEVDSIKKDLDGFKITFSERIDEATTTSSIEIKKADGTISGSITTIDERTFKFTPDEMLTANQEYTLWVYSTLKDLSGKSINQFFHSFMLLPDDFLVYEKPDPNKHVYSRIGNNYLFHGREYEPEVGLYYYRHRYYMPRIGRFLQTDPMQYQDSMNLYQAFGMNPVNFTDPFGTKIKTEDLYELKRISESKGPDAAKRWIDRNPNFTSGEKLDLHMKVIFGFKDPDEFSVLNDWISSTTYDIGKPFGLEGYLKFHAGVKYNQPGLQAEGLAEIGEKGVTFGVVGHYVGVGIQKLAEKFPWFRKTLDFLTKPVSKLFKRGGGSTATSGVKLGKLTAEGNTYWRSSSGLRYGPDPRFGNRIQHVLRHSVDDTSRAGLHGVFDAGKKGTLNVIDEAWNIAKQGGPGVSVVTQGSRTVYTIDIGRRIGYVGGQVGASLGNPAAHHIQLVIKGVDDVITAFPIIPGLL